MKWHEDENNRKQIGDSTEKLFEKQVRCYCGGKFNFIGNLRAGFPDFTCENCGQLVDVKSSPQSEKTGNIAVSAIPWSNYPDEMFLVTRIKGQWIGEYKKHIRPKNTNPFAPTHHGAGKFKNTEFHLIAWRNFQTLENFGYSIQDGQL